MKHILIVDDNKTNLTSAKLVLNDIYKVTPVISGAQALKFLENNTTDLILLDINMPEMDGFEVMTKIRATEKSSHIPIIFLTADNDAETESRCLEAGALDFIAKPFVPGVMRSRIGRILELEELRKGLANKLEEKIQDLQQRKAELAGAMLSTGQAQNVQITPEDLQSIFRPLAEQDMSSDE